MQRLLKAISLHFLELKRRMKTQFGCWIVIIQVCLFYNDIWFLTRSPPPRVLVTGKACSGVINHLPWVKC